MLNHKALAALAAVIAEQSFDKAAASLHLTQSAISQRVKQLETQFGLALVVRSTPVRATSAGRKLLNFYRQVEVLERDLLSQLQPREAHGWRRFSLGVNADTLAIWLLPAVADWCSANRVLLNLKVDDQDQTHRLLAAGEVLACISSQYRVQQGCDCTSLGAMAYLCVASRSFRDQYFPRGMNRKSIRKAPVILFNNKDELQFQYLLRYFDLQRHELFYHSVPSSEGYLEWMLRGLGFGMVPEVQARPYLENNSLCELNPGKALLVDLYWHRWSLKSAFMDQLTALIVAKAHEAHQSGC